MKVKRFIAKKKINPSLILHLFIPIFSAHVFDEFSNRCKKVESIRTVKILIAKGIQTPKGLVSVKL